MNFTPELILAILGQVLSLGVVIGVMRSSSESTKEQLLQFRRDMDTRIQELRDDLASHRARVHDLGNQHHQMSMEVIKTLAELAGNGRH